MKIALLILVIANFAVFAWLRWAGNSQQEANLVPLAVTGKKLVLLPRTVAKSEPPVASTARGTTKATHPATPAVPATLAAIALGPATANIESRPPGVAAVCLVWPLASSTAAKTLITRLEAGGYSAHLSSRKAQLPGDYHVSLGGFSDTAAAQSAAAALRRGGMGDLYLLPAAGTRGPSLSVGVFADRDHAKRRAERVRALGFDPKIRAEVKARGRRHLETRLPTATSVSGVLRAVGIARLPHRVACATSVGSASAAASTP